MTTSDIDIESQSHAVFSRHTSTQRAVVRVVLGGAVAMVVTYGIGQLVAPNL